MVFNIVTGQNLECHDVPSAHTPRISIQKGNFLLSDDSDSTHITSKSKDQNFSLR